MDPELAKALALIVPGLPALVGTLIGATIGGTITYLTARQTRRGALDLDRQRARRDDLLAILGPLRTVVATRTEQMLHARSASVFMLSADGEDDPEEWEEAQAALDAVRDVAPLYAGGWAGAGIPNIAERYDAWRLQDRRCYRNLRSIRRDGAHDGNYGPEADALWNQYVELSGALTGLLNDIIHGVAPARPEPSRRGLSQRAAKLLRLPARR